jgi:transcriptional regulator with XRE-family HTH domain
MSYINDLIDSYKCEKNYSQDKQVAFDLDVSRQYINKLRNGVSTCSDEKLILLAKGANVDPLIAIASFHVEWTDSEVEKPVWQQLLKRLDGVAAALFAGVLSYEHINTNFLQCILC